MSSLGEGSRNLQQSITLPIALWQSAGRDIEYISGHSVFKPAIIDPILISVENDPIPLYVLHKAFLAPNIFSRSAKYEGSPGLHWLLSERQAILPLNGHDALLAAADEAPWDGDVLEDFISILSIYHDSAFLYINVNRPVLAGELDIDVCEALEGVSPVL